MLLDDLSSDWRVILSHFGMETVANMLEDEEEGSLESFWSLRANTAANRRRDMARANQLAEGIVTKL